MAGRAKRILIAEHDEELASLMKEVLEVGGYEATSFIEGSAHQYQRSDFLGQVAAFSPDLLLIDLLPGAEDANATFLDQLRLDPRSATIPILTVTTSENTAYRSVASYNVRETLTKPFYLEELLEKVHRALGEPVVAPTPPSPCPGEEVFCEAQRILAYYSREALFRWVQRLMEEPSYKGRKDLHLASQLDAVPLLMEAVIAAVAHQSAAELFRRSPDVIERARRHAETRMSQGISLEGLMREYTLLRDEITELFLRHLPKHLTTDDILSLDRVVNTTLDRIIEVSVPAYVHRQEAAG